MLLGIPIINFGQINQIWDKLISFIYKNINLGNPQLPDWLFKRKRYLEI